MRWEPIISRLSEGDRVVIRPRGGSMTPRIHSGQEVTIVPIHPGHTFCVGDVVLARVRGSYYLHLIKAIDGDRIQIANNHGRINGWTTKSRVYGRAVV